MQKKPQATEAEITVFGPGYGESVVVHFGDDRWFIVDSTLGNRDGEPASIRYLRSLGVELENAVELIVITHWHDDHIRGAVATIDACPRAKICVSQALTEKEFQKFAGALSSNTQSAHGSGVDEFIGVVERMMMAGRGPHRGSQDKRILSIGAGHLSHAQSFELWTLSPSDFQTTVSEAKFAERQPEAGKAVKRAVPTGPNNHSVALWLVFGDANVILGADLETTPDPRAGWDSVVLSKNRPQGQVDYLKVPHHGSITGHHNGLWENVLEENPVTVITPWNRNKGLPLASDIERLGRLTGRLFLTAPTNSLVRAKHDHDVEKLMRKFGVKTYRHPSQIAAVTARRGLEGSLGEWIVTEWEMSN